MNNQPSRRHVLGITSVIVTGLAGCLSEDDQPENDTSPDESDINSSEETTNQTEGGNSDSGNESEETTNQTGGESSDSENESEKTTNQTSGESSDSGNESDQNETDSVSESAAEVTMVTNDSGTHFEPHVAEIEPGETVTWTLESGAHTTTAYALANDKPQRIPDDAEAWDSGTIDDQGATFEHTFETEGVYDYYCRPHETTGMIGCVVVGDPQLDDQPGMAEPQSELPDGTHEKIRELNDMVRSGGDSGHGGHDSSEDEDDDHEHEDDGHEDDH